MLQLQAAGRVFIRTELVGSPDRRDNNFFFSVADFENRARRRTEISAARADYFYSRPSVRVYTSIRCLNQPCNALATFSSMFRVHIIQYTCVVLKRSFYGIISAACVAGDGGGVRRPSSTVGIKLPLALTRIARFKFFFFFHYYLYYVFIFSRVLVRYE